MLESLDRYPARRRSWSVRDFGLACSEPLLLFHGNPVPWWIAQYRIESALRENLRKLQMPMEEMIQAGKLADGLPCELRRLPLGVAKLPPELVRRRSMVQFSLLLWPDEGGAPSV